MRQIAPLTKWRIRTAISEALTSGKNLFRGTLVLLGFLIAFSPTEVSAQIDVDGSPADWGTLLAAPGGVKKRIADGLSTGDSIFTQGSKDILPIGGWTWTTGSANDKTQIANAGFAYIGTRMYFFIDRIATNGDANVGFWLTKNRITPMADGSFDGEHDNSDILIQSDFTNGGRVDDIRAYRWDGGALTPLVLAEDDLFAFVNAGPELAPWPYTPKQGADGTYPANAFFEGVIDLSKVGLDLDVCTGTFIATTRVSASFSASLSDLVIGGFADPDVFQATPVGTCAGQNQGSITVSPVQVGTTYTLNPGNISNMDGIFNGLAPDTYSITAVNAAGCSTVTGGIIIPSFPAPICTITGVQAICAGDPAVTWTVGAGQGTYVWEYRATPQAAWGTVGGNSNTLSVSNAGEYRVRITSANGCICESMARTFTVNPLPTVYNPASTPVCAPATGTITTTNSTVGVNYQLQTEGGANVQAAQPGSGAGLSWTGLAAGTYKILATNATTLCASTTNNVTVVINPLPETRTLTGSTVCAPNLGTVTMTGSQTGVNYQLQITPANTDVQAAQPGTGNNIVWSNLPAGTYRVVATNPTTTCTSTFGSAPVAIVDLPLTQDLTGSTQCAPATGTVNMAGSQTGISYQLQITPANTPVQDPKVGTGNAMSWTGLAAGTYRVVATVGQNCTTIIGPATVVINPLPLERTPVGSILCQNLEGNATGSVTLATSQTGVNYQLQTSPGNAPVGAAQAGTGNTLTWSGLAAGSYRVVATTNAPASCERILTPVVTVVINPLPAMQVLTGSEVCRPESGTVTQTTSVTGINYQLQRDVAMVWTNTQAAKAGTGGELVWSGAEIVPGTYRVIATNATTTCSRTYGAAVVSWKECYPICSASQGFYGNKPGNICFDQMKYTTPEAMMNAFGADTEVKFGIGNRSFNLRKTDLDAYIYSLLPGGGTSKAIDAYGANGVYFTEGNMKNANGSWLAVPLDTRQNKALNGKIRNGLLAQTITTWFNWRNSKELASTVIEKAVLVTEPVNCDADNTPIIDPITLEPVKKETKLPLSVVEYLNYGNPKMNTVGDLYALAIAYLGGETKSYWKMVGDVNTEFVVPIGDITEALSQIIEAFHDCAWLRGQQDDFTPVPTTDPIVLGAMEVDSKIDGLEVSTFPNPVVNNLRFVIRSEVSGQAQLEMVDAQGRVMQKAYNGFVQAGRNQNVDVNVTGYSSGPIFYRLTVGGKSASGKVIKVKR